MEHNLVRKKRTSNDAVDQTVEMLEGLFKDCPIPKDEDFKKMAGIQMAFMNALGINIMKSMTGDKKLDRGLLRLSMKASELCLKAAAVGAAIKVEEKEVVPRNP